ncbi:MAG: alpha/beta fold hydrolase [Leptospirales bacterium]|nr:alpha/beta fold hydrolase [Leptospirales bacterium]
MPATFDECFQTFPTLNPPKDFSQFWKLALESLKRIPVEPKQKMVIKRSLVREQVTEVHFKSIGGYNLRAQLTVPRKRGRVPGVISFHDYLENKNMDVDRALGDAGLAHLRLDLRGHEKVEPPPLVPPRHCIETGLDPANESYPFYCILDAVRALDYLRLQESIDPGRVGLIGRGLGGMMAAFVAGLYPDKVRSVALERPGFLFLNKWNNESLSPLAAEVREIYAKSARMKTRSRKALEYLDCLYFVREMKQQFFVTVGLGDAKNLPAPAFALFNHLQTEKTMDLFPDEERDPNGTEQRKKSIQFLAETLQ